MDKPIPWKELELPEGRTIKAVQVMVDKEKSKVRKAQAAAAGEEGSEAPGTPTPATPASKGKVRVSLYDITRCSADLCSRSAAPKMLEMSPTRKQRRYVRPARRSPLQQTRTMRRSSRNQARRTESCSEGWHFESSQQAWTRRRAYSGMVLR